MPIRRLAAVLALMLSASPLGPASAANPSFDCAKASTAVEGMICGDDGLARRDRLLAAVYKRALDRLDADASIELRDAQRAWARGRAEACQSDGAAGIACLSAHYDARIDAVRPLSYDNLRLYPGAEVQADRRSPLVCLKFDAPLAAKQTAAAESYVASGGGESLAVRIAGDALCVEGLAHGAKHRLTVKRGLAGEGAILRADISADVEIPDRPRRIVFPSRGSILPMAEARGLPIETVNVDRVRVLLLRVDDADVVKSLRQGLLARRISYADVGRVASKLGSNVWTGEIEIDGARNQSARTLIPIAETAPVREPGVYLAVAEDPESPVEQGWWAASQWFVMSELGMTTFIGADGLTVAARNLSTGAPAAAARVSLIAADGSTLSDIRTDAEGVARIPPGFLRGDGDAAPRAVYVYGEAQDFVYLDLDRAPLDLSDRGVDGRTAPGALDAYLTAERGVYRPGETVHLTGLLRDAASRAVVGLPLTLKVLRHDGLEVFRRTLADKGAGGYTAELSLPPTAATGMWRATLHAAPDGAPVGQARFLVEDFTPPRLEALLDAAVDGPTLKADIAANYLYGAPASNLPGEIRVDVRPATNPIAGLDGYRFGRVEEAPPQSYRAAGQGFKTDGDGVARMNVGVGDWPGTSYPLEAHVQASLFDVGGRPINVSETVPLANLPLMIGVRPLFDGDGVPEGGVAAFDVQAFNAGGDGVARRLEYSIVREEIEYLWFQSGDRWDYRIQYLDREIVESGDLLAKPGTPARIERRFDDWGGYRLTVRDAETSLAASVRFRAGWWGAETASAEPAPDRVKVTLPAGPFQPGDTVKALIEPPFDGRVLVVVADDRIRQSINLDAPASGVEVELTLPSDAAGGAYVLATAFAPSEGVRSLTPRRALGAAYAAFDPAPKTLPLAISTPEETTPGRTVDISLDVGAPSGESAFVTLAAVDDGVLGLTGYEAPDPRARFLGKRRLGLEIRDVYGQFIDAAGAAVGRVRSGGDEESRPKVATANLPERTIEVVSLFSGVVAVGPDGRAVIPVRLPEFTGRLRLMAQGWSADRVGAAEATMLVRRTAVASLGMPRFLSPGDTARISISLRNVSGSKGAYSAKLTATGSVSSAPDAGISATLDVTDLAALGHADISAGDPGPGMLSLEVTGPDGLKFTVERALSVRPAAPVETRTVTAKVEPGGTFTAPPDFLAGFFPASAHVTAGVNPLPDLDLPSIIGGLRRYPYGCAEQTTSTATPMLYAGALSRELGLAGDLTPKQSVAKGVARLLGMQTYSGGFGFWDDQYEASPWITAYAADFLAQARRFGADTPEGPLNRALDRLSAIADSALRSNRDFEASAYALYVRARAGVADPARVRRFAEQVGGGERSAVTLALTGGALAAAGDSAAAANMLLKSQAASPKAARGGYGYYASPVRDLALRLALMAESGAVAWPALEAEAKALSEGVRSRRWLSTQEQAWVVRAAAALGDVAGEDGVPVGMGSYRQASLAGGPPSVRNGSTRTVTGVISVIGAPSAPREKLSAGFEITRAYFSEKGDRIDPSALRQNDLVVVFIAGRQLEDGRARALLVDYLPAGFELENAKLGGRDLGAYSWLGALTSPDHQELRNDRFVAAFPSQGGRAFRVAYLARAVTPGIFAHGAARIEAMYQPEQFGRSAPASVSVTGP